MKKEILFVLLNEFADWEGAFIAPMLNAGVEPGQAKFTVKTISKTKEPVTSIGGFSVLPDYDIQSIPDEYEGVILIGGMTWFSADTEWIVSLVQKTIEKNKLVAGICNGSVFLGKHGFLNEVKHTSNTLEYLKELAKEKYSGDANYINEQAVRDQKIVTANGAAYLEFCKEILYALDADTPEKIEEAYGFYKHGFIDSIKK